MARVSLLAGILLACLSLTHATQADWKKLLEQAVGGDAGAKAANAALSNDDVVAGLKEALAKGAESAVNALGRTDGFLGNAAVRIPLPERLEPISKVLKAVGQQRYTDEFVQTMNRAAEAAVPEASGILGDAIRQMSVEDARRILNGPDDAATQYFRKVGEERLTQRMKPIVSDATSQAGVTSAYKSLVDKGGYAAKLAGADTVDVDSYVTQEALDGLFLLIAQEEKRIRENPVARSTELLKKVFAAGG